MLHHHRGSALICWDRNTVWHRLGSSAATHAIWQGWPHATQDFHTSKRAHTRTPACTHTQAHNSVVSCFHVIACKHMRFSRPALQNQPSCNQALCRLQAIKSIMPKNYILTLMIITMTNTSWEQLKWTILITAELPIGGGGKDSYFWQTILITTSSAANQPNYIFVCVSWWMTEIHNQNC